MKKIILATLFLVTCAQASTDDKPYPIIGTLTPIHETKIGTQVSGRVKEVHVRMGDRIKKGQLLLELDPVFLNIELKKQTALTEIADASYQEAVKEYQRFKSLWEKNPPSVSQKSYEDAEIRCKMRKAQLDQALADLENTRQKLQETQIVAPYDGVIVKRNVDFGESVTTTPAVTVAEMIDDSQLIFEFTVPQDLVETLDLQTTKVHLEIPGLDIPFVGTISAISPQVEKESRTLLCQIVINNLDGKIHSGLFVKGTLSKE